MRGFACLALYNPKKPENVGSVLRAASCFDVALVALVGTRTAKVRASTDTTKAWRHIPVLRSVEMPPIYDCQRVVVELTNYSEPLWTFKHPERACYIFGPEDGSVPERIVRDYTVYIPSSHCLNLAMCANVVMYDRMMKNAMKGEKHGKANNTYRQNHRP